jgi:hypothetical protein
MNLHGIVAPLVAAVNPTIYATIQVSAGETQNADFTRSPAFTTFTLVPIQVQALSYTDLQRIDGLTLQGVKRAIYVQGNIEGLVRADNRGGDLVVFPEYPGGPDQTWLVATVLEHWPDWVKIAATLQNGS